MSQPKTGQASGTKWGVRKRNQSARTPDKTRVSGEEPIIRTDLSNREIQEPKGRDIGSIKIYTPDGAGSTDSLLYYNRNDNNTTLLCTHCIKAPFDYLRFI